MPLDLAYLQQWVGKTEMRQDQITPAPAALLSATLDRDDPPLKTGDALPPLWHWLYFLPADRPSELGPDGHAKRGGFLPQVPLPRRMWAGGRFEFLRPLRVGDTLIRVSRIIDVKGKEGRSGSLVFVVVRHEISGAEGLALVEEQDLVYTQGAYRDRTRPADLAPDPQAAPGASAWERTIVPDDVLLFRYSALTFNGHRIHYDRRYAGEVEGYPGLVVHGPLIATLLLDLLCRNQPRASVARFAFRAVSPLFDTGAVTVCGDPDSDGKTIRLWARNAEGGLAMSATATLA